MKYLTKKILIYHYAAVGDTIVTILCLRTILRHHKNDQVDIINTVPYPGKSKYHVSLLHDLEHFHKVESLILKPLYCPETFIKRLANLLKIRREGYDQAYLFFIEGVPEWWKKLFAKITGIPKIFFLDPPKSGIRISEDLRNQISVYGLEVPYEFCNLKYPLSVKHRETAKLFFEKLS